MPEFGRYVLLPRDGLIAARSSDAEVALARLPMARSTSEAIPAFLHPEIDAGRMKVIDTTKENGPKLVEMSREDAEEVANASDSPVRALPVIEYDPPDPELLPLAGPASGGGLASLTVECQDAASGAPLANVRVVAFSNFATRRGDAGHTDHAGLVSLQVSGNAVERLYAYAPPGYWGGFRKGIAVPGQITLPIEPVDLSYTDAVRRYYGTTNFDHSTGVTIGVIDTGVGPHRDLTIVSGRNTVTGEPSTDYEDPRGHGTHVAGLIASNGAPPSGLRGIAPGIELHAFRVFPANGGATNYAVLKAMIFAAENRCDIINLSLGGGPFDRIVAEAVQDARNQGMLVVVAAGNGGRKPINYPAAYSGATAISAMGRRGTFPSGSLPEGDIEFPPYSTRDSEEFVASFSNVGSGIAMTGLGAGVLSTLPGDQFGPMSGTSMAAPVVAGAAASLLSQDPTIYGMPRDQARATAIERLVQSNCIRRGFDSGVTAVHEGYGLPNPSSV